MKRILLILPILFEAISEGLELRGIKVWGKQVEILELASWFYILYLVWREGFTSWHSFFDGSVKYIGDFHPVKVIIVYVLLRTIFFNYVHNIAAGLPLNYLGTVSIIDRIAALMGMGNWYIIGLIQLICAVGVWVIIKRKI